MLALAFFATAAMVVDAGGIYIDGADYELNDDAGTAKIVGWYKKYPPTDVGAAEIEHAGKKYTVTSVANLAFYECHSLTSISLPNVTEVGEEAFEGCSNLTVVSLPNVTKIGQKAFEVSYDLDLLVVNEDMKATIEKDGRYYFGIHNYVNIVSGFLSEEVVTNAVYVVQEAVVETNVQVKVSSDVKVQPSVTLKNGDTVLSEAYYELSCAHHGVVPQTKPATPKIPDDPTASDYKVVSKDAQVVQEGEIAVKKTELQAAKAEAISVSNGVVTLGVNVCSNANFTAETKTWAPVELKSENVEVKDGKIVISIPVGDKSGFMILQSGDANVPAERLDSMWGVLVVD